MISRRNIRVKVMQSLYSVESQITESATNPEPIADAKKNSKPAQSLEPGKILQKHFDQTRQLFVYLIHFLTEVALYAETNARNRASKHLPSKEDLEVNTKIADNELLVKILELPSYKQALKEDKTFLPANPELLRKIYGDLVNAEKYRQYISSTGREKKEEKDILEFIFTDLMLPNESFTGHVEEFFSNWDDDAEMLNVLMINFLAKPSTYNFQELISREKWEFAKS